MWLLVSALLLPLVSSSCMDTESPISIYCVILTVLQLPNFRFDLDSWKPEDWNMYLVQDYKYLKDYNEVVVKNIETRCKNVIPDDKLTEIVGNLSITMVAEDYEKDYGAENVETAEKAQLLEDYQQYYKSQTDCKDLVSVALPCLCIYTPIAQAVKFFSPYGERLPKVKKWVEDNASYEGTSCAMLKAAVPEVSVAQYQQAMKMEVQFFALNKHSQVVPKGKDDL